MLILLGGCQYFNKPVSEDELLEKELQGIDWKKVDEMPSIATCDSLTDKAARQQCFFDVLSQTIQEKLNADTLPAQNAADTLKVRVTVFPDSTVEFSPEFPTDSVVYDKAKIDSMIRARLTDFPKIKPAIKRGLPVKTQFTLPVVLQTD